MAKASELDLLNAFVIKYLQQTVLPHLTEAELQEYKRDYQDRLEFHLELFSPTYHPLVSELDELSATTLDAMLAQALFGRAEMMEEPWFRENYRLHGARLDMVPRKRHPEIAKLEDAIFGRTGGYEAPEETTIPSAGRHSTRKLLASLHDKIDQMNDSETKQHKELEELFTVLSMSYPGLRGVLCGVRSSFRGRDDRCAERQALFDATTE